MSETENNGKSRRENLPVVILSVLLAAAIIVILLLLLRNCGVGEGGAGDTSTEFVIGGGEPIEETGEVEKLSGSIHLPAYSQIEFVAGKKEQTVVLPNPTENNCLIRISLILPDGTVIWTSEYVEPGHYTVPIVLRAPMERGIYKNVRLKYECFKRDGSLDRLNGAESKLTVVVK